MPCAGLACWDPEPTTEPWQLQLQGAIDLSVPAPVYDLDLDSAEGVVDAIHAQGDRAICYMSAGTYEEYIHRDTRTLERYFRKVGVKTKTIYTHEGHSFGAWRNLTPDMLEYFFPAHAERGERSAAPEAP